MHEEKFLQKEVLVGFQKIVSIRDCFTTTFEFDPEFEPLLPRTKNSINQYYLTYPSLVAFVSLSSVFLS